MENNHPVSGAIGDPINYIKEAAISTEVVTDESHLLFY